jgi:hypothetical protein
MSRHVAKISVCFQGFPIFAGGSTRHRRNMKWEKSSSFSVREFARHYVWRELLCELNLHDVLVSVMFVRKMQTL